MTETFVFQDILKKTKNQLLIQKYFFSEVRLFEDKGYGFLKFQTHLAATQAICEMTGQMLNGCQV